MAKTRIILIALTLSLILITACNQIAPPPRVQDRLGGSGAEPAAQPSSPTGAASRASRGMPEQIQEQNESTTVDGQKAPEPQEQAADGLNRIELVPAGETTDDDIVKSMALLKVELGVKPELKVTEISRTGHGKDSRIIVTTELSSTKPIISVINAIKNRERFEGRLGDNVLFNNNDLRFVCRLPVCAAVEDMSECPSVKGGYECAWTFGLVVWETAGQKVADAAKGMPAHQEGYEMVIDTPLNLYLNDQLLDYVFIPANMTDAPITDMTVTGNATGKTPKEAQDRAIAEMDRVRDTISRKVLPVDLNVVG